MKKSQYPTDRIRTQRINPSIPLPSIVRHACITARTAAAAANGFHVERRLTWILSFGFSFITSDVLREDAKRMFLKHKIQPVIASLLRSSQ